MSLGGNACQLGPSFGGERVNLLQWSDALLSSSQGAHWPALSNLHAMGTPPASFVKPFRGSYQLVEGPLYHVHVVTELRVRKLD